MFTLEPISNKAIWRHIEFIRLWAGYRPASLWYKHIMSIKENKRPKQALYCVSINRIKRGRPAPRKRDLRQIEVRMRFRGE